MPAQSSSRAGSTSVSLSRQGSALDLPSQAAKSPSAPKADSKVLLRSASSKAKRSVGMKSTELFAHLPQYRVQTHSSVSSTPLSKDTSEMFIGGCLLKACIPETA